MKTDETSPDNFPFRILLALPQATHIPYFAVQFDRVQYDIQCVSSPSVHFNGNLLRSLPGRFEPFSFLNIRHRRSERAATYSSWLGFASQDTARRFLTTVKRQRHGLNALIERSELELAEARRTFDANLAGGLFDLGRLQDKQRRKQAELFIRLSDDIQKLGRQVAGARRFRERPFWEHPGLSIG